MSLFFAWSAALSFVVMGADRTNVYANALSPTQPTFVQIEDASRHGKEVDNSLVLPVLKVLQGHPDVVDHTRAKFLPRNDRREGRPSVPTRRRYRCRLIRHNCGARLD
jgi:hypothetical protein